MLSCYRVLDLTDEKGFLCGKALADLGADVIKIEKPGGDDARRKGPFFHDIPDPQKSLYWFAFNGNKRGITLNIELSDGKELFKQLVKTADVVIESFAPGYMDELGLGYAVLSQVNPKIVLTQITPFGQEGPYRDYKGPDIVAHALSGLMYCIGDIDRPPLAPSYSHAHLISAIFGAIGTLVALYHRHSTGRGKRVDVSTQQGLVFVSSVEFQALWAFYKEIQRRTGGKSYTRQIKGGKRISHPFVWKCKDGRITFTLVLGPWGEKGNTALVEWIKSEGLNPGPLGRWNWKKMDWSSIESEEEAEEVFKILSNFFLQHTKSELFEASLKMGFHIGPVLTVEEMLKFPQHIQRGFWKDIEHPELGTAITYPGGFSKMTGGTCGIKHRAPLIGEHNKEVYKKGLGISGKDLVDLKQRGII